MSEQEIAKGVVNLAELTASLAQENKVLKAENAQLRLNDAATWERLDYAVGQNGVLKAEVERLRVIELPELTDEAIVALPGDNAEALFSLIHQSPDRSTVNVGMTWSKLAYDLVALLNEGRKV